MRTMLKNYMYISDTKVDMLYSQIPKKQLARIAGELHIDLNLFFFSAGASLKKDQQLETRYSKLEVVVKYLEKYESAKIGTLDNPGVYIKDILLMCSIPLKSHGDGTKCIYFGGSTEHTILGLGGSLRHVIGNTSDASIGEPSSALPYLISYLADVGDFKRRSKSFNDTSLAIDGVEVMEKQMQGPRSRLEFIAKFYLDDASLGRIPRSDSKRIIIGSPLYVAWAE